MMGFSLSFSSKRSFLFRKRITEVLINHLLFRMEPNSLSASSIRFYIHRNGSVKYTLTKEEWYIWWGSLDIHTTTIILNSAEFLYA